MGEPKLTGLEKIRMLVKHVQYAEGELTSFGWRDAVNMSWFGDTPLQVYRYIANMNRIWASIEAKPPQRMEMLQTHIENEKSGVRLNGVLGQSYEAWKSQKRSLDGSIRPEYSAQGILSLLEHYCIDEVTKQNKKSREKSVKDTSIQTQTTVALLCQLKARKLRPRPRLTPKLKLQKNRN